MSAGLHVYTMDHEVGPWKMAIFHGPIDGPTFMIRFLKKSIYKASLGVNRMWTKGNDHKKYECADFLTCLKNRQSWKLFQFGHSVVFLLSSFFIPPPKKFIIITFLCHGPMPFLLEHLFCLSHLSQHKACWTMLVDNIGLFIICLLRTLNFIGHYDIFFLGVKRSGTRMTSTSNHKFYKALG